MKNAKVEINLFYMHFKDASKFLELAKHEDTPLKSFYARHSILSSVFACEAMINRVYNNYYIGEADLQKIERFSIEEKWLLSPRLCKTEHFNGLAFRKGEEPFQSLKEIIKIRNWFVHPKADEFVEAVVDGTISYGDLLNIPYVRTIKGKSVWPQTKIPINPFEIDEKHAENVLKNIEQMIDILLKIFESIIDRRWLLEFTFKIENENTIENFHTDWLWGGYTPGDLNDL